VLFSGEATSAFDRGMEDEVKHDIDACLKMRTTLIARTGSRRFGMCRISSGSTTDPFGD
jgi:hypothetical protein